MSADSSSDAKGGGGGNGVEGGGNMAILSVYRGLGHLAVNGLARFAVENDDEQARRPARRTDS
jgi:hypothetical protein